MTAVLEKFAEFFNPQEEDIIPVEEDVDAVKLEEAINDTKRFVGTQAYRDYRSMLKQAIYACTPDPKLGTDVAGAMALKQAGLRESLEALDRVSRQKEDV